jgi:hypothetical protein
MGDNFTFPFSVFHFTLPHILLRAVVQHPEAHFPLVGGGKKLDAGAVEGGAEPGLRVKPQIHAQPLLMAFVVHMLHLGVRMPGMGAAQSENASCFVEISKRVSENLQISRDNPQIFANPLTFCQKEFILIKYSPP